MQKLVEEHEYVDGSRKKTPGPHTFYRSHKRFETHIHADYHCIFRDDDYSLLDELGLPFNIASFPGMHEK